MADNLTAQSGAPATPAAGTVYRSLIDASSQEWFPGVCTFVTAGSAGSWTFQLVDATHGLPVAMVGNVSAAVAADTSPAGGTISAADVASSATVSTMGQTLYTGTPTANSSRSVTVTGGCTFGLQVTGTFAGNIVVERSLDDGATWVGFDVGIVGVAGSQTLITDQCVAFGSCAVAAQIRARAAGWTSGTAAVAWRLGAAVAEVNARQLTEQWGVVINSGSVGVTGNVAATVADGADVTLGAKADAAASADTGTFSLMAAAKRLLARVTTLLAQLPAALTSSGNLKVSLQESTASQAVTGTFWQTTQPVSLASLPALAAGSAIAGKFTTDQTTHGTTDLVAADITKVAGSAIAQGHGTAATAVRVELPTDGTGVVGLAAGALLIGHVIVDSGTVRPSPR